MKIIHKRFQRPDGQFSDVYTCLDGRYRLWPDQAPGSTRWRWALDTWPDDGLGIPTHGACASLALAVEACKEHDRQRQAVTAGTAL